MFDSSCICSGEKHFKNWSPLLKAIDFYQNKYSLNESLLSELFNAHLNRFSSAFIIENFSIFHSEHMVIVLYTKSFYKNNLKLYVLCVYTNKKNYVYISRNLFLKYISLLVLKKLLSVMVSNHDIDTFSLALNNFKIKWFLYQSVWLS